MTRKPLSKGVKIGLIAVGIGVTGLIAYYVIKAIRKRMDGGNAGDEENTESYDTDDEVKQPNYNASVTRDSYPETPFANETEGNKFRAWVNDNYPKYASQISLDRKGTFDNSFVRKAYAQYGAEYNKSVKEKDVTSRATNPLSAEFKSLLSSWNKPVYYTKAGVGYFTLKFRKNPNSFGSDSDCKGVVYIFNTSEAYIKGKSNDKRGVMKVNWGGKEIASAYWSNYLKKFDGISGEMKGVKTENQTSLIDVVRKQCKLPNAKWC
jgi:hypothetical protein